MKTLTDYNFWMSLFNNNSAQMLQNNQSRYETRQSSQNSQNIFNNSNTNTQNTTFNNSQNPFSNQNTSQNLFNNQGTSQNIFNNQGTKNMFSNTNNTQGNLTSMNDGNLQAQFRTMSQQHEIMTIMQQIHQLQQDPDLIKLMRLIELTNLKIQTTMDRATKESQNIKKESLESANQIKKKVQQKSQAIRQKNSYLLQRLLNFKTQLSQKCFQWKVRSTKNEIQMENLTLKIREKGEEVRKKLNAFKLQKLFNKTAPKKNVKSVQIKRPLQELKLVTEKLARQMLQVKEEFKLFSKFWNGEPF